MAWGFQSWDANGVPNNYGITPITVVGRFSLATDQVSGTFNYSVPAGYALEYIQCPTAMAYTSVRRVITISGGAVTISQGADTSFGIGTEMAQAAVIVLYLRKV